MASAAGMSASAVFSKWSHSNHSSFVLRRNAPVTVPEMRDETQRCGSSVNAHSHKTLCAQLPICHLGARAEEESDGGRCVRA